MNKETLRAIKFTLFSISAGIVEAVTLALLNEFSPLPKHISYLIALVLSVLWNFTFNRRYTFQSAGNVPKAMALVALFYCVFAPTSTWLVKKWLVPVGMSISRPLSTCSSTLSQSICTINLSSSAMTRIPMQPQSRRSSRKAGSK